MPPRESGSAKMNGWQIPVGSHRKVSPKHRLYRILILIWCYGRVAVSTVKSAGRPLCGRERHLQLTKAITNSAVHSRSAVHVCSLDDFGSEIKWTSNYHEMPKLQ